MVNWYNFNIRKFNGVIYSFLNIGIYVNIEVIYLFFFIDIKLILKVIFCIEKIDLLNIFFIIC